MPFLQVTIPQVAKDVKRALIERLTDAAVEAGFEREIFRVCISAYEIGDAGRAGIPWDGIHDIPPLHLVLYTPRLPVRMKKSAIEKLSAAFLQVMAKPDWWPIVHILEYSYDNLGLHGQIAWEFHPDLKAQKYYNNLTEDLES